MDIRIDSRRSPRRFASMALEAVREIAKARWWASPRITISLEPVYLRVGHRLWIFPACDSEEARRAILAELPASRRKAKEHRVGRRGQ